MSNLQQPAKHLPELPEVESVVRGLARSLPGHRVQRTEVRRPDVVPGGAHRLQRNLKGARMVSVRRRAKNIVIQLAPDGILAVNLGMTGRLLYFRNGRSARTSHPAVRFHLDQGSRLIFDDVRRFGTVECMTDAEWSTRDVRLGPEPLSDDFTPDRLMDGLARSRSPLRSWLLDQRKVAGVGNIYANEALFLAELHPQRSANTVDRARAEALYQGLRLTLSEAVELGGTTLRDYVDSEGRRGQYASNLRVYGREGLPCLRCQDPVVRSVFGGRSAFHCPSCQPRSVST